LRRVEDDTNQLSIQMGRQAKT